MLTLQQYKSISEGRDAAPKTRPVRDATAEGIDLFLRRRGRPAASEPRRARPVDIVAIANSVPPEALENPAIREAIERGQRAYERWMEHIDDDEEPQAKRARMTSTSPTAFIPDPDQIDRARRAKRGISDDVVDAGIDLFLQRRPSTAATERDDYAIGVPSKE